MTHQRKLEAAHKEAYDHVASYIHIHVLENLEVVSLPQLCSLYKEKLAATEFANENFRGENLKVNTCIIIWQPLTYLLVNN